MIPLRDGYIMSSTKGRSLKVYDIESVGASYVNVGSPFAFIRSSSATRVSRLKQKRDLIDSKNTQLFITRSGVHNQNFDTVVLSSASDLDSESPLERLARLFYCQIRALTFAHSFYLRQVDDGKIAGSNRLEPAIEALIERIKGLSPIEGSAHDRDTCEALRKILENADINTSALAKEIERRLKRGLVKKADLADLWVLRQEGRYSYRSHRQHRNEAGADRWPLKILGSTECSARLYR